MYGTQHHVVALHDTQLFKNSDCINPSQVTFGFYLFFARRVTVGLGVVTSVDC